MKQNWLKTLSTISLTALALSACGPQGFVPGSVNALQEAPGSMNIPPRVDVVVGFGMGGTMRNIFPGMANELPAFAQGLQNSGWDYRFVNLPLHETLPGSSFVLDHNVSASVYHTNYVPFGLWKAPYPGAVNTDPSLFMLSSFFSQTFFFPSSVTTPNDGREPGLKSIADFVSRSDVNTGASNTGLIRPDAMLAVIVISNDDDKSGGQWRCKWNPTLGAYPATCQSYDLEWVAPSTDNLPAFRTALINAKGGSSTLVRFYSLVAPPTVYCRGYAARWGDRYTRFANMMGGKTIDICANQLTAALDQVKQDLTVQKLNFRKRYLVVGSKPDAGTIKVTKFANGQGSGQLLVQGDPNGWNYIGGPQTVYTIDSPVPMAQATGYVIELLGNARLTGNDTATVTYMNNGAVISQ